MQPNALSNSVKSETKMAASSKGGGWDILNRLRRLGVAYPLRSCFMRRVGNSVQGWRTMAGGAPCGFQGAVFVAPIRVPDPP